MSNSYEYTGTIQPTAEEQAAGVQPYLPDPRLVRALKLSITLGRPLLLQGEPGCGKTQLAFHLAYELARANKLPPGELWPLESWPVQSVSRARDGLYLYDAVGRLSNAQLAYLGREEAKPLNSFIRYGPLGQAIRPTDDAGQRLDKRTIVLIDEIDKADIDFPNDLLWVLDQREFQIQELGGGAEAWVKADPQRRPIVIITSNREKELPGPFLRRCFYYFIQFPGKSELETILGAHLPDLHAKLREKVVQRFRELRADLEARNLPGKPISTGELIDWARALQLHQPEEMEELLADRSQAPEPNVLFKNQEQYEAFVPRRSSD